ncbi:MAG TPA: hypothetical protein VF623_08450 [Segetibacter sp.]
MKYLLTFVLIIFNTISFAQSFSYPIIKTTASHVNDFVPVGWMILDSASGDLNKDGFNDVAVILQLKDSVSLVNSEADTVLTQPRVLIILFKNRIDNSFRLIEQSTSFILSHENSSMEDPYEDLVIENGILQFRFRLFYSAGSWDITNANYKFRYIGGQFILIGADKYILIRASLNYKEYSYNFLNGKRSFTTGNEEKHTKKTEWKAINLSSIKNLKTFAAPFTWEVEKDFFL